MMDFESTVMDFESTAVTACDKRWDLEIDLFRKALTLLQYDHREIRLSTGIRYLRILHPSMLQGHNIVDWVFWCRHHLSEKQLERLEEVLPSLCISGGKAS